MNKNESIIRKLGNKEIKEIKESLASNYTTFPRLGKDGRILPSQWKVWQNLQRYSIGFIIGSDEEGKFELSEFGKEVARELNEQ